MVSHQYRLIGQHFAGVPQVALVLFQQRLTRSHEQLIRRLLLPALIRRDDPAQARPRRLYAQRVV